LDFGGAVVATTAGAVSSGSSGSGGIPKTAASPFSRRNYSNNKDLRINSEKISKPSLSAAQLPLREAKRVWGKGLPNLRPMGRMRTG